MKQGAEAAVLALSVFVSKVIRSSRASREDSLLMGMGQANDEVFKLLRGGGGTTLSAVLIPRSGGASICHVGDSRIYSIGKSSLQQLTHDDTIGAALKKSPDTAYETRDTRLLQFVGMGSDLEAQIFQPKAPDTRAYLLSSDGAHDVPNALLQRVVGIARSNLDLARKLIRLSEVLGGLDNATVAVVPSTIQEDTERPVEGLDITLLAPIGQLSIWIPQLIDEGRVPAASLGSELVSKSADAVAANAPVAERVKAELPSKPSKKSSKAKNAKRKASQEARSSGDELPLSESLNIQFPERNEK
jgi:hypothetical protein